MRTPLRPVLVALLAALALPHASLAAPADSSGLVLLGLPPAGLPASVRRAPAELPVRVWIDARGLVTRAEVARSSGSRAYDSSAVAAARWAVFRAPGSERTHTLFVRPESTSAQPLRPIDDAIAHAVAAERRGDWAAACDYWLGAVGRVGSHPEFANAWAIYERAILAARRLPKPPRLPVKYLQAMVRAEGMAERTLSDQSHRDLLAQVGPIVKAAPWHAAGWRMMASSEAGLGNVADAARALQCWRLAANDSVTSQRADAALARLAAGDLLGTSSALRR